MLWETWHAGQVLRASCRQPALATPTHAPAMPHSSGPSTHSFSPPMQAHATLAMAAAWSAGCALALACLLAAGVLCALCGALGVLAASAFTLACWAALAAGCAGAGGWGCHARHMGDVCTHAHLHTPNASGASVCESARCVCVHTCTCARRRARSSPVARFFSVTLAVSPLAVCDIAVFSLAVFSLLLGALCASAGALAIGGFTLWGGAAAVAAERVVCTAHGAAVR
jgi:hypothetical protein